MSLIEIVSASTPQAVRAVYVSYSALITVIPTFEPSVSFMASPLAAEVLSRNEPVESDKSASIEYFITAFLFSLSLFIKTADT